MSQIPFLTDEDTRNLIDFDTLFSRLERGLLEFSSRNADLIVQPVRSTLSIPGAGDALFLTMPSYSASEEAISCKMLTFFPDNVDRPVINGVVTLFNARNGATRAVMQANALTELRTAVASAIATKHLIATGDVIPKLALLGSGVQGRGHLEVFKHFFKVNDLTIWSRTMSNAKKLAHEFGARAVASIKEAVENADVIITATNSAEPILNFDWVKPGAHINSVGACRPDWREIDNQLMTSSIVYTDSREAAALEAGDIVQTGAEIYAEIGEVIAKTKSVTRNKTTIFKSLGMAVEDTIAAQVVYDAHTSSCARLMENVLT